MNLGTDLDKAQYDALRDLLTVYLPIAFLIGVVALGLWLVWEGYLLNRADARRIQRHAPRSHVHVIHETKEHTS